MAITRTTNPDSTRALETPPSNLSIDGMDDLQVQSFEAYVKDRHYFASSTYFHAACDMTSTRISGLGIDLKDPKLRSLCKR
jgi:hypothetical protein